MREKLSAGGSVTFSPKGNSMLPMLRRAGDSVTLTAPGKLKRGSVALFVTEEEGARRFVLHRLVRIKKGGALVFCGDHRRECDSEGPASAVIGVVSEYESRGKKHRLTEPWYRLYSLWMVATWPFRSAALKLQSLVYKAWKKLKQKRN